MFCRHSPIWYLPDNRAWREEHTTLCNQPANLGDKFRGNTDRGKTFVKSLFGGMLSLRTLGMSETRTDENIDENIAENMDD